MTRETITKVSMWTPEGIKDSFVATIYTTETSERWQADHKGKKFKTTTEDEVITTKGFSTHEEALSFLKSQCPVKKEVVHDVFRG